MIDLAIRQRGRGFDPRRLFAGSEQGVWYDPQDLGAMRQNADGTGAAAVDMPVGRLIDKSGRGNHAVQAVADARPVLRRGASGRLYLEFDGVDDRLVSGAIAFGAVTDRVSAIRQLGWTTADLIFQSHASDYGLLQQAGASPGLRLYSGVAGPSSLALAVGADGLIAERFDGAGSRIAINGGAATTGNAGTGLANMISVGGRVSGSGASNIRFYGVVMIGRALNDAETLRLTRFMARRAGIAF